MTAPGSANAFGARHHHIHAAHRGHMHDGGGNRKGQRARMIGPAQDELGPLRHLELVERAPIGERLAGMVHCGFEVDQRRIAQLIDAAEHALIEILLEILAIGEGAHTRAHRSTMRGRECPRV